MSKIVSLAADLGGAWMSHRASAERLVGSIDQLMAPVVEKSGLFRSERIVAPASVELLMGDLRAASADDAQRAVAQLAAVRADSRVFKGTGAELVDAKLALLIGVEEAVAGASLSPREALDTINHVKSSLDDALTLRPTELREFLADGNMAVELTSSAVIDTMAATADANLRGWIDSARPVISRSGSVAIDGDRTLAVLKGQHWLDSRAWENKSASTRNAHTVNDWPVHVLGSESRHLKRELLRTKPGGADAMMHIENTVNNASIRDERNVQLAEMLSSSETERAAEGSMTVEGIRQGFSEATEIGHVREMLS